MADKVLVSRYAEAFAGYARGSVGLERALQDVTSLRRMIYENPELLSFLKADEVSFKEKEQFIDKIFGELYSEQFRNFLKLLLEKERINCLSDVLEYLRVKYTHEGEEDVLLKTTFPLDLEVIQKIENRLQEKFNKKFRFYIDLDASLLGGIQVVIGNKILDGSVRKKLNDLKFKLLETKVSE